MIKNINETSFSWEKKWTSFYQSTFLGGSRKWSCKWTLSPSLGRGVECCKRQAGRLPWEEVLWVAQHPKFSSMVTHLPSVYFKDFQLLLWTQSLVSGEWSLINRKLSQHFITEDFWNIAASLQNLSRTSQKSPGLDPAIASWCSDWIPQLSQQDVMQLSSGIWATESHRKVW